MSGKNYKCLHNKQRQMCRECGGNGICGHDRQRSTCKQCGTHLHMLRGGFSPEEIKEIGAVAGCQFPGCLVQAILQTNGRRLNSDHRHDGHKINTENYRGELCFGHNTMLSDFDRHPEWANADALEYMRRRPYAKKK